MELELHKSTPRFYEIDLLRFLAALSVVCYHYTYRGHAADNYSPLFFPAIGNITKYGYLGVELFFIISGYVVLLSAQGKMVQQFFVSRVTRLYPAFWVACTLTFAVKHIYSTELINMHVTSFLQADIKQYGFNMTMLQGFFGVVDMDSAYWSLTLEITFYFIIAILIGFKLLKHLDWFLSAWLVYTALPSLAHQYNSPFAQLFFPVFAPYFIAGMVFYLIQKSQGRTCWRYLMLIISYLLAIRMAVGQAHGLNDKFHDYFSPAVVICIITCFFGLFLLIAFRRINLEHYAWLAWLGELTYPLYLVHSDVGFIIFHLLARIINKYVLVIGVIILMLSLAYLISDLVEKPLSKLLRIKLNEWLT